jgi:hypothetical protein
MNKDIKNFVEVLKSEIEDGWNVVSLGKVEATPSFHCIAMYKTVAYADENNLLIFVNESGVEKTNQELYVEGADFDDDNEELLNEFKDELYGDIEIAIAELGGVSIGSAPDKEELFEKVCIKSGISKEDIDGFGTLERFDLVYKF